MKILWNTLRMFICLSGVLAIWLKFIIGTALRKFLGVFAEVTVSSNLKSVRAWFFKKDLGCWTKYAQDEVFQVLRKTRGTFLIFCMLQKHNLLNLTIAIFFGKILFWGFRAKWAQNGPKIRLYKFCEKLTLKFSDFLHKVTPVFKVKIDVKEYFGGKKACFEVF